MVKNRLSSGSQQFGDACFVAIDETRAHLEALGIPPGRLTGSGIPIDPAFARPRDRDAMRPAPDPLACENSLMTAMITITLPDGRFHGSSNRRSERITNPPRPPFGRSLIRRTHPRPAFNRRRFLGTAAAAATVGGLLGPGI